MHYIQRKDRQTHQLETVDQERNYYTARKLRDEYQHADPDGRYYISNRPCHDWREQSVGALPFPYDFKDGETT